MEHQVNYIYNDEANSTKTSSSMNDAPMDLTTELPEFKNLALFRSLDEDFLSESIENLFLTKDVVEYKEDPILVREYEKRQSTRRDSLNPLLIHESQLARRNSLNPLHSLEDIENCAAADEQCREEHCASDEQTDNSQHVRIEEQLQDKENPINTEDTPRPGAKKSLDGSFNDTAITNSSYVVEELVNTIDLRAMIPKKERMDINDFLASMGIRFLDESMADGMRRDTLSKSRNEIDPALHYHYKYSVKERIDYLYNFSGFLSEKIKELQEAIDDVQKGIEVEDLNKDLLKKIRNESRNKAKIDWYALRKINELQFNKKIVTNRTRIQETLTAKARELERVEAAAAARRESVAALRARRGEIHGRLLANNPEELLEAEKLQQMICDRRALLVSAKAEHDRMVKRLEENEADERLLDRVLAKLKDENERLKKNLMIKSVSEGALEEAKGRFRRLCIMYGLKILSITKSQVALSIFSNKVAFTLNSAFEVVGCEIVPSEHDSPYELVEGVFETVDFPSCLRAIVGRFVLAHALGGELERLREKCRLECFYVGQLLHLRLVAGMGKRTMDIAVDSQFRLLFKSTVVGSLYDDLGILHALIENEMKG